jgi:hypothetical protein
MPGMADLSREIRNTIKDEERHSLFKDIDQQILLLFAMAFGQANPFYGECDYKNSSNKDLTNLLLTKVLYPEKTLSENYLAPPPWCPKDGWVCIGFPCVSFKKTKSLKTFLISQLRRTIGLKDREDLTLIHLWNKAKKVNAIPFHKEMHEPWSLIPVNELGDVLKKKLFEIVPLLERHFDKLFVCPDHFRFLTPSLKNKRNLCGFIPTMLKRQLDSGEVSLSSKSFCNLNSKTGHPLKNTHWLANCLGGLWDSSPRVPPLHDRELGKKEAWLAFKKALKFPIFPNYGFMSSPWTSWPPR